MNKKIGFQKIVALATTSTLISFSPIYFTSNNQLHNEVKAETMILARQSLPMKISFSEGYYNLTVPDRQTTKSAYGGTLRIYDEHIAKMFEVTYTDCQEFGEGGNREWSYYADNGNINMGTFYVPCELVNYVFNQLGVGTAQTTSILVG